MTEEAEEFVVDLLAHELRRIGYVIDAVEDGAPIWADVHATVAQRLLHADLAPWQSELLARGRREGWLE